MSGEPDLDGAVATAKLLLASVKKADADSGRNAFAIDAFFTISHIGFAPEEAEVLIGKARRGDQIAKEAVHQVILSLVADQESLPQPLFDYLVDLLRLEAGPKKRLGYGNYLRDDLIRLAARAVSAHGFNLTRNEATREKTADESEVHSACSIVRDVLAEFGLDLAEKTLEDIVLARPD